MERPKKQKEQCELNFLLSIWCIFFFQVCYFRYIRFFPSGRFLYKVVYLNLLSA